MQGYMGYTKLYKEIFREIRIWKRDSKKGGYGFDDVQDIQASYHLFHSPEASELASASDMERLDFLLLVVVSWLVGSMSGGRVTR